MITYEDRLKVFEEELSLIIDPIIKEFTKLCLHSAPDYVFEDCPASTSGKYHPLDELGADGTIIHTKKVVTVAYTLCRGLNCEQYRDEIISACIIHDLLKQGREKSGHTTKNHPSLAADLVANIQQTTELLTEESYNIIRNSVGYHYGLWSQQAWLKDLKSYSLAELCVYMSDYIASKREFSVDSQRFSFGDKNGKQ